MKKKNKYVVLMAIFLIALVIGQIAIAKKEKKDFDDDEKAKDWKKDFKDYPKIKKDAEITEIHGEVDNEEVTFEWAMEVENKRDNLTLNLTGVFYILREQINNTTHIDERAEYEIEKAFDIYNASFERHAEVYYKNHTHKGKKYKIK